MSWSSLLVPLLASLLAAPAPAQSFDSIELRGGGVVTVRHGPAHRVTVIAADPGREIRSAGDRLVIEPCSAGCRHGHRLEVEVVTPDVESLAVSNGGLIQLVGNFPPRREVAAAVSNGGTIDIRRLDAAAVSASVSQGGRILTRPGRSLSAAISDGGIVTFWGNPAVTSSVRRGGIVAPGAPGDFAVSAARLEPHMPVLPRLPRLAAPPPPPRAPGK